MARTSITRPPRSTVPASSGQLAICVEGRFGRLHRGRDDRDRYGIVLERLQFSIAGGVVGMRRCVCPHGDQRNRTAMVASGGQRWNRQLQGRRDICRRLPIRYPGAARARVRNRKIDKLASRNRCGRIGGEMYRSGLYIRGSAIPAVPCTSGPALCSRPAAGRPARIGRRRVTASAEGIAVVGAVVGVGGAVAVSGAANPAEQAAAIITKYGAARILQAVVIYTLLYGWKPAA